jgi:hypothetical protein
MARESVWRRCRRILARNVLPWPWSALTLAVVCGICTVALAAGPVWHSPGPVPFGLWVQLAWTSALAAGASLGSALTMVARRRRKRYDLRRTQGRCGACGHDLTGTTAVRCPKCGAWHGTIPARHARPARSAG